MEPKNFKEAYEQGVRDEKTEWKLKLKKILNKCDEEDWINRKYLEKMYNEEEI